MTLTREENELLTHIGPGTPAGEVLRRYWHPIAVAKELTDDNPTMFIRVLGEDLVLFKDRSGRAGLIADHCVHRGASLLAIDQDSALLAGHSAQATMPISSEP